jgi:hypothetical protein
MTTLPSSKIKLSKEKKQSIRTKNTAERGNSSLKNIKKWLKEDNANIAKTEQQRLAEYKINLEVKRAKRKGKIL